MDEKTNAWFRKQGKTPPEHISHEMTPDDIKDKVQPLKPTNWRQEGNLLKADTEMGELVQVLPTDRILTGTNDQGLPILKRI